MGQMVPQVNFLNNQERFKIDFEVPKGYQKEIKKLKMSTIEAEIEHENTHLFGIAFWVGLGLFRCRFRCQEISNTMCFYKVP